LGFFLSDLEEAEEEAGEAAEAAPGAEVGVRGLLLPSGLEDSDDLCRDEKKRPLKTIAASPEFRRTGGGRGGGETAHTERSEGERAGGDSAEEM
jgi:hypothetical protein